MSGPLDGIRIIDWTIWQQGPVATQMLADLGAEVIKIEERERGDPGRGITAVAGSATVKGGRNYYFEANNKHKKSIALDLKQPEARAIVHRLAARSDVFVQNFRKGVAQRLGLGYADLATHNPRLIYASASGYGPEGPDSGEPSFDYLGQARSGIMNAVGSGEHDADLRLRRHRRSDGRDHACLRSAGGAVRARADGNRAGSGCVALWAR